MGGYFGPQVPGGRYLCGYWQEEYTVLAMWSQVDGRQRWIRVMWADGRVGSHCTPWDARSDRVVAGHEFTRCAAGVVYVHAAAPGAGMVAPLCGWVAAGELITGDESLVTCPDCLPAMGAAPAGPRKPSEMGAADLERYLAALWSDAKPLGWYEPEPLGPESEPWAGIKEGEQ